MNSNVRVDTRVKVDSQTNSQTDGLPDSPLLDNFYLQVELKICDEGLDQIKK